MDLDWAVIPADLALTDYTTNPSTIRTKMELGGRPQERSEGLDLAVEH